MRVLTRISGIVLMENSFHCVVEFMAEHCAPLAGQRIAVLCVVARRI